MTATSRGKPIRRISRVPWICRLALTVAAALAYTAAMVGSAAADDAPTITLSQVKDSEAVLITWTSVSNATGYRIERSKGWLGGDEQYINISDDQASQYTDTAVQYDNVYQYRVRAKKDGTDGAWSEQKHIQTSAPPGTPDTPTNVQSQEETPGDVTITWEHPEEGDSRAGYHVYRYDWSSGDGDVKIATKGTSETSHTDSTVSPETLYSYHLRAYNEIGNSMASETTTITTKVQTPGVPDAPTSLTASEDPPRQVDLDWDAPDEGETVNGYKVYRYRWTSGASDSCKTILLATLDANTTSYADTSPEAEVFYEYHVRAYNDKGRSTISNIAYLTTQATQTASQEDSGTEDTNNSPTGLPTISGPPQVEQSLTASTSNIDDADGLTNVSYRYQWVRNDGTDDADIAGATGSTYTLVDADEGRTIKVKVSFTDDADNDESLTSAATETVLARPNRAAAGLPTISGTPQVEQTLTADTSGISDEDGLSNVSYGYQWLAGGAAISAATGSSYQLTSAEQGKTIQVRVTFTDDRNNSESLTSAATKAVAAKPVPLTATFSNVPASHSGSGKFTFDLAFSENFPLSYRTLRDHAFIEDDNGPVTKARRKVQGSNQTWTITVESRDNGAITITLPATTDCNATGAICTDDGRKLSHSTTVTVSGTQ